MSRRQLLSPHTTGTTAFGDPGNRPPRPQPMWHNAVESNDVGIHEFVAFCRLLGAEPDLVVNSGSGRLGPRPRKWDTAMDPLALVWGRCGRRMAIPSHPTFASGALATACTVCRANRRTFILSIVNPTEADQEITPRITGIRLGGPGTLRPIAAPNVNAAHSSKFLNEGWRKRCKFRL